MRISDWSSDVCSSDLLTERFSPNRWWQEIAETRATIIHYLGVVPPLLLNQPETPAEKQHRVRFGLGAGVEPELHGVFEQRFGFPQIGRASCRERVCQYV